jgi:excisionase family DNA binding protein
MPGNIRKTVLTTGDVARICSVAPRTVSKWFDSGRLKGYRIPGSRDRRIPLDELLRFMKAHEMPAPNIDNGAVRVLIVDSDRDQASAMAEALRQGAGYDVRIVCSNFQTGLAMEKFVPNIVLVNIDAGGIDPADICGSIRGHEQLSSIKIAGFSRKATCETASAQPEGLDTCLSAFRDTAELVSNIEELLAVAC